MGMGLILGTFALTATNFTFGQEVIDLGRFKIEQVTVDSSVDHHRSKVTFCGLNRTQLLSREELDAKEKTTGHRPHQIVDSLDSAQLHCNRSVQAFLQTVDQRQELILLEEGESGEITTFLMSPASLFHPYCKRHIGEHPTDSTALFADGSPSLCRALYFADLRKFLFFPNLNPEKNYEDQQIWTAILLGGISFGSKSRVEIQISKSAKNIEVLYRRDVALLLEHEGWNYRYQLRKLPE